MDIFDELNNVPERTYDVWQDHWQGMPVFAAREAKCHKLLDVSFDTEEDYKKFSDILELSMTADTKSRWFPHKSATDYSTMRYVSDLTEERKTPKFPIYIVSKSRWETRLTSDALVSMKVKHYIVVEEEQFEQYNSVVNHEFVTVLILDKKYQDEYDTFDDLGNSRSKGPGAARNFAWDHSISLGAERHWVMDDNARGFYRLHDEFRILVNDGAVLRAMEDHSSRYENCYISGPNYRMFAAPAVALPAFIFNTRIYSCLLIKNDIPYRWRGRYNEDTDLSLRVLKDGHCTIQYNAFLYDKIATQTMQGGNTAEFYAHEGTKNKSMMLEAMHPDCAKVVDRYGRIHHHVDYSGFRNNRLKFIDGFDSSALSEIDEYGMRIEYDL